MRPSRGCRHGRGRRGGGDDRAQHVLRRGAERRSGARALRGCAWRRRPKKHRVKRLRLSPDAGEHGRHHLRMRRLGDEHNARRCRVGVEQVDGRQGRQCADLAAEIAAADADRLRNPPSGHREQAAYLLQTGAGGADETDIAARNAVGKRQWGAADDGGAAVRAQHQAAQRLPSRLSATSSARGTLSLKIITSSPQQSALRASAAA